MKKARIIIVSILLFIVVLLLGFSVYTILKQNLGIANHVVFETGADDVFVKISGTYEGPELQIEYSGHETYTFTLDKNNPDAYKDGSADIDPWELGRTDFTNSKTKITFTFTIENLNNETDMAVDITKIACDVDEKFETTYTLYDDINTIAEEKLTAVDNNTASISQFVIPKNSKINVRIVYELKKFNKEFAFKNDLHFLFTAVYEE